MCYIWIFSSILHTFQAFRLNDVPSGQRWQEGMVCHHWQCWCCHVDPPQPRLHSSSTPQLQEETSPACPWQPLAFRDRQSKLPSWSPSPRNSFYFHSARKWPEAVQKFTLKPHLWSQVTIVLVPYPSSSTSSNVWLTHLARSDAFMWGSPTQKW